MPLPTHNPIPGRPRAGLRQFRVAATLGVSLLAMASVPTPACAADPVATLSATGPAWLAIEWTERLADLNPVPGPITLRGDRGEFELFFNVSARIDPVGGRLHLELSNSQALLPGRSQLVIRLNDVVVAQVALKPDAPLSSLDIDLPVELVRGGANRLNFVAAQHYTNECEYPAAAELWSQIDTTRSRLSFKGRPLDTAPVLSDLQDLIGPGFFGGRDFTVMTPSADGALPDAAIATGGILAQALALRLRYQPAVLAFADARSDGGAGPGLHLALPPTIIPTSRSPAATSTARGAADIVLFGTLDALRPMLGTDIAAAVTGGFIGIYALPSDASRLVVVVSGRNEAELARAAAAFGITSFPFVDAPQQTVDDLVARPQDSFFSTNAVKEGAKTTFAEMGLKTATIRGVAGRVGMDAVLPPDLYVADSSEVELSLDYAYGAGLRSDSVMNMFINGEFQQAIALSDRDGAVLRRYSVRVPARKLLPGKNRIEFEVVMTPLISGACVVSETRNMILTLSDTSTIALTQGSHYAAQPDLHLFAATGFPYAGSPGFDMAVATRDPATVTAAWMLSARLAQVAGRVLTEANFVVGAPAAGRHVILVGAAPDLPPAMAAALPVQLGPNGSLPYASSAPAPDAALSNWQMVSGLLGLARASAARPPSAPPSRLGGSGPLGRNGLVMAAQAPGGGSFTLTAVTAATPEALRAAVVALVRPQVWPGMENDVAVWRPAAAGSDVPPAMNTERVGPTYHLGSFRSLGALRYLVGEYPWVWIGALAASVLLLVGTLRLFLVVRMRRVHPSSTEGVS